jgi:hypothetical protein
LSPEYVRRSGRPPGFQTYHLVVGAVLGVAWVGILAFVLMHGKDDGSSVDVYSELPPGFTTSLQQQGVRYSGLSPVDGPTVQQVLAHATTAGGGAPGGNPIVLRTSFTDHGKGASFTDQPALMVVVPPAQQSAAGSGSSVYVAFLDPTSYKTLTTVTYDASGVSG